MRAALGMASIALLASAFSVGTSEAQTPVAENAKARVAAALIKIKAGCADDVAKFCSTVTPGEGRLILCMMAHEDKISSKCDFVLYEASRKLERGLALVEQAADVCWPDIEKHCANIPEGGGHIAQCLLTNRANVASDCRTALDQFPAAR